MLLGRKEKEHMSAIPDYYRAEIGGEVADMYAICLAHGITDPSICHAIKYLLRAGKKVGETKVEAVTKASWALARCIELEAKRDSE